MDDNPSLIGGPLLRDLRIARARVLGKPAVTTPIELPRRASLNRQFVRVLDVGSLPIGPMSGAGGGLGGSAYSDGVVTIRNEPTGEWVDLGRCWVTESSGRALQLDRRYAATELNNKTLTPPSGGPEESRPVFVTGMGCCTETPTGCCDADDCEALCLTITDLTLYYQDGSVAFTRPGPMFLTYYYIKNGGYVTYYPGPAYLPFLSGFQYFNEVYSNTSDYAARDHETVTITAVIGCFDDAEHASRLYTTVFVSGWKIVAGDPVAYAPQYNGARRPLFTNTSPDCDLDHICVTTPTAVLLPVDPFGSPAPNVGSIGLTYTLTRGGCGYPGERCYSRYCTGVSQTSMHNYWCCDSGTNWFCNDGVTYTRTSMPLTLTATVTTAVCGNLPLGTTWTWSKAFDEAVSGRVIAAYQANQYAFSGFFLVCNGDMYSPYYTPFVLTDSRRVVLAGSITHIYSCNPIDLEITITNNALPYAGGNGCAGTVIRVTE